MAQNRKINLLSLSFDLVLLAFCFLCFFHVRIALVDDCFIAYRYAANLIHGSGLVFNPGERVEGFSDLSWTVLMVVPELLHLRPELFAVATTSLCGAFAFVIARRTAVHSLGVSPLISLLVVGLVAFNCDFWIMAGNGIESGLYALVLVGSLSLLLNQRFFWAGVTLAFATTLRPESIALAPLAVLCFSVESLIRNRSVSAFFLSLRPLRPLVLTWAVIVASVLLWRHHYYGAWVQNTVVAKAHQLHFADISEGVDYLVQFASGSAPWIAALGCVIFFRAPVTVLIALLWIGFQMVVILGNAGDWMPGYRMMTVFLPILALLSAFAFHRLAKSKWTLWCGILALASTCLLVQIRYRGWTRSQGLLNRPKLVEMLDTDANSFLQIATALKPALNARDIAAPEMSGIFSYTLPQTIIHDWLGLTDAHIARYGTVPYPMIGKADPLYSFETISPTLFIFMRPEETLRSFERLTSGKFSRKYAFWTFVDSRGRILFAIRRDREQDLITALRKADIPVRKGLPPL